MSIGAQDGEIEFIGDKLFLSPFFYALKQSINGV